MSPILWRKVKQGLSAGRVQSVAVRLLVEREREINSFESKVYYKVVGQFINKEGRSFKAEVNSRLDTLEEAQGFLQKCIDARFSVANLEKKSAAKSPAALSDFNSSAGSCSEVGIFCFSNNDCCSTFV